jgi:hypothetical protein
MGDWGTAPWQNDSAADWFMNMMDATGLAKYVQHTLRQEIDDDDPGATADQIRAAAAVLLLLGHHHVWSGDDLVDDLKLAIARLEKILAMDYGISCSEQIRAEIAALKSRLEENALNRPERIKWWHFDEK